MQVVNLIHGEQALSEDIVKEALRHDTPEDMVHYGYEKGESGALRAIGGVGLMFAGGSLAVLAGERHPRAFNTGRVMWGVGVALGANGVKSWRAGSFVEQAGKSVQQALFSGKAKTLPLYKH
jgi:divalent metal cation (Fe/Co/Zn/Cd) transporter